jgi:hypothetical protein
MLLGSIATFAVSGYDNTSYNGRLNDICDGKDSNSKNSEVSNA